VKELRKKRGFTQKKLGEWIHASQSYISRIEHGHIDSLTIRKIRKLSQIFEIEPWEMLKILEKNAIKAGKKS